MPYLRCNITSIYSNVRYAYGGLWKSFVINVSNIDNKVLEIGESFIFTSSRTSQLNNDGKKNINGQITIGKKSVQSKEFLTLNNFDENKIGEVVFLQPEEGYEGHIVFQLHLDDDFFDVIEKYFINQIPISSLTLEIPSLEYGWEPDNSRVIWRLEKDEERGYKNLDINEFSLIYEGKLK